MLYPDSSLALLASFWIASKLILLPAKISLPKISTKLPTAAPAITSGLDESIGFPLIYLTTALDCLSISSLVSASR